MSAMTDIRAALEEEIDNVVGIPATDQRCWENVRFEPTTGTAWVRMTIAPTSSRPATRGSSPQLRYQGLFLVDVFMPEADGPNAGDVLADAIRDRFDVDVVLTKNATAVRFDWSERAQAISDSPWYQIPVTISWYSYRS